MFFKNQNKYTPQKMVVLQKVFKYSAAICSERVYHELSHEALNISN